MKLIAIWSRSQPFCTMTCWMPLLTQEDTLEPFLPLAMMYFVSSASETRAIMTSASDSTISRQALSPSS